MPFLHKSNSKNISSSSPRQSTVPQSQQTRYIWMCALWKKRSYTKVYGTTPQKMKGLIVAPKPKYIVTEHGAIGFTSFQVLVHTYMGVLIYLGFVFRTFRFWLQGRRTSFSSARSSPPAVPSRPGLQAFERRGDIVHPFGPDPFFSSLRVPRLNK